MENPPKYNIILSDEFIEILIFPIDHEKKANGAPIVSIILSARLMANIVYVDIEAIRSSNGLFLMYHYDFNCLQFTNEGQIVFNVAKEVAKEIIENAIGAFVGQLSAKGAFEGLSGAFVAYGSYRDGEYMANLVVTTLMQ
jgi:hypothetical protein